MNTIETTGLTKYYGTSKGVEDINLVVQQGEIFGFIGPNGAGKSTTIRLLLGLIRPTRGSATIFGQSIATHGARIREEIGYVPSEVFYYDNMRVWDLLRYSASFYKKPRRDMERRAEQLASLFNLDVHAKIDKLSYGNKKKVGIVQGLLHSPQLIILDEPTGGLDPLIKATFFELLQSENARGATILFSSHVLSEVQKLCHRVAIIKDGCLVAVEHIDALRKNSYVNVTLELVAPIARKRLERAGISHIDISHRRVSFLYRGDINALIGFMAGLRLRSVSIAEPELEELFMHYYRKETT